MVVNTPSGGSARADGYEIRAAAVAADKPLFTTIAELGAAVASRRASRERTGFAGRPSLQEYGQRRAAPEQHRREQRIAERRASVSPGSASASTARSRATASCASASTRTRGCSTQWGWLTPPRRARVRAAGGRGAPPAGSASSSRRWRSSSATARPGFAALEDVLGRRPRGRAARDRRRQARRHRHDAWTPTATAWLTPGLAARGGRDDRQPLPGRRLPRPVHRSAPPRRRARACSCSPRRPTPRRRDPADGRRWQRASRPDRPSRRRSSPTRWNHAQRRRRDAASAPRRRARRHRRPGRLRHRRPTPTAPPRPRRCSRRASATRARVPTQVRRSFGALGAGVVRRACRRRHPVGPPGRRRPSPSADRRPARATARPDACA